MYALTNKIIMMKKSLAAVAVLTALSTCAVAADLELYGVIDTGFTYTHGYDDSRNTFEMSTGNYAGSRFGLRGSEKLDETLTVSFVIEGGFNSNTGAYAEDGKIFNRESQINISGPWGTLGFGRVGAFVSGSSSTGWFWDMDPFETGYTDAGLQGTQVNVWRLNSNTVYYVSPVFKGFKLGVQHSFTGANDTEAVRQGDNNTFTNAALRWDGATARAMVAATMETFGDNEQWQNTAAGGEKFSTRRDNAYEFKIAGAWQPNAGPLTVYVGASYFKNYTTFSDSSWDDDGDVNYDRDSSRRLDGYSLYLAGKYTVGAADLLASVQYQDGENKGGDGSQESDFKRYVAALGCHYHFSPNTMLYAVASYADGTGLYNALASTETDRLSAHLGLTHYF